MTKTFWITDNRFKFIAVILFAMFCIFMLLFYLKAEEITNDPCSICAKQLGEDVTCSSGWGLDRKQIIYEGEFKSLYPKPTVEIINIPAEKIVTK